MKVLKSYKEGMNIVPLKIIYDRQYDKGDIISIVYKDVDTGKKYVENIPDPMYEMYIIKPEYRNNKNFDAKYCSAYMHDAIEKDMCKKIVCKWRDRTRVAAKELKISYDEVEYSPYVFNFDIDIKQWYFSQVLHEYPYNGLVSVKSGYLDIETDISRTNVMGLSPIVCITYISETTKTVYNLAVKNSNYKQNDYYIDHMNEFIADCKESFAMYNKYIDGEWNYECLVYDTEIAMLTAIWDIVHLVDDDYLGAWNAPFDFVSLIERTKNLGMDPFKVICDPRFSFKKIDVEVDNSIKVTKRRHKFDITVIPVMACYMTMYGNTHAAESVIPSFKLNVIADKELKDKKVEYKDTYKNITDFLYSDFYTFNKYNIKDVFLMVGINHSSHEVDDTFSRTQSYGIQFPEVFSSNNMMQSVLHNEFDAMGLVFGINRNKNNLGVQITMISDEEDDCEDDFDVVVESQTVFDENGEKKKFAGALVQNPKRMQPTGYKINGIPAKYIHTWCMDEDLESLYPTIMIVFNMSNKTMIGKIIMSNDNDIDLPTYQPYSFVDIEEEKDYSYNKAAIMCETVAQKDFIIAGNIAMKLPSILEVTEMLKERVNCHAIGASK
jgi:DNA polymerase elongation subunit (family B)